MIGINGSFHENLIAAPPSTSQPTFIVVYVVIFAICSMVGTVGNITIILALVLNKALRKLRNIFVGSLAMADLMVSCITMPASIVGNIFISRSWNLLMLTKVMLIIVQFKSALRGQQWFDVNYGTCIAVATFCAPSCIASMYSIAWVAISRYFYVARISVYNRYFTREHIIFYVCSIWMFGYAVHVPNHLGWGKVHFSHLFHFCTFDTESLSYKLFYGGMLALAIVLAFIFYMKIYLVLRHTTLARHMILHKQGGNKIKTIDGQNPTKSRSKNALVEETKMIKATFKIFVLFFICWAPVSVLILIDQGDKIPVWLYLYAALLAHCNSTLNFLVYFFQNDNFIKAFKILARRVAGRPSTVAPNQPTTGMFVAKQTTHC